MDITAQRVVLFRAPHAEECQDQDQMGSGDVVSPGAFPDRSLSPSPILWPHNRFPEWRQRQCAVHPSSRSIRWLGHVTACEPQASAGLPSATVQRHSTSARASPTVPSHRPPVPVEVHSGTHVHRTLTVKLPPPARPLACAVPSADGQSPNKRRRSVRYAPPHSAHVSPSSGSAKSPSGEYRLNQHLSAPPRQGGWRLIPTLLYCPGEGSGLAPER